MAIFLATSRPQANIEGDQIAVAFESGDETITIALSLNQALALSHRIKNASQQMMHDTLDRPVPACAQIIPFRRTVAA